MGEIEPLKMLRRAPAMVVAIARADLSLEVEQGLGIAKLRCFHGIDHDAAFQVVIGAAAPKPLGRTDVGDLAFSWLAPGEWLITGDETAVGAWVRQAEELGGDDILAVDFTHARQSFLLAGPAARTALAAHCPLDLDDAGFPTGTVARSLLGDTVMFIARLGDDDVGPRFRTIVDQTMAAYAARLLARA